MFSAILESHFTFLFICVQQKLNFKGKKVVGIVLQMEPIHYSWSSDDPIHQIMKTGTTQTDADEVLKRERYKQKIWNRLHKIKSYFL